MALAKDAFANRNALLRHREQRCSVSTLVAHAFFPAVRGTAVPWPPVFVVTLSVECSFSRDRDVLLFKSVDERRVVEQLDAFPARENYRQVVFRVLAKLDSRIACDFEIDVALQVNGAGEIHAGCNDDLATAGFRALIDSAAKSCGAISSPVGFSAEVIDIECSFGEARWFDACEYRRHHCLPGILDREQTWGEGKRCSGKQKSFDEFASCRHVRVHLERVLAQRRKGAKEEAKFIFFAALSLPLCVFA